MNDPHIEPGPYDETTNQVVRSIVFLHPSAEFRGADRTLLSLVAALDRTRWHPVVALPRRGPIIGQLEELGATVEVGDLGVIGNGFGGTRWVSLVLRLPLCLFFVWRLLRRHRPALVHTHSIAVLGGALAAHLMAPRHIWHVHSVLPRQGLRGRLAAGCVHMLAGSVVCSSSAAKAALEALSPSMADRCSLVRNAIDEAQVAAAPGAREDLRDRLGFDDGTLLVLVVGPVTGRSGHVDVVRAVAALRYNHPDVRVLMVGDATARNRSAGRALDTVISEHGLDGVVTRAPFRKDIASSYAAADVVCIPGHEADPYQAVALEAMAAGRPVIATATPGTDEYVRAGRNGLIYEPGDVERLAWCIGTLSGDANRRHGMGHAGLDLRTADFLLARFRNECDRVWSSSTKRGFVLPATRAKIIHVVLGRANPERLNGINYVVHSLATTQFRFGLNVTLWGITKEPDAPTLPREYPALYFQRLWNRFSIDAALQRAIDELDTTAIVHLHGAFLPELVEVARRLRRRGVPYVVTPHGSYMPGALERGRLGKAVWYRLFGRRMLRGARAVQALSGRELVAMERRCDFERLHVVPNGQDAIIPPREIPRDVATVKRPLFCFCGRLSAHTKGLDALLQGFARYVAARGTGSLWLIGDGDDRAALTALAEELGVQRRVHFFGALFGDEKHARVAAADAFVHPSRHEGMPTAVLEAGALARPLLVTPGTNLDAEVRRAGAGFVIPEVTPEAIALALTNAENEAQRGRLAERGQRAAWLVATHFAWSRVTALVARDLYGLQGVGDPDVEDAPLPAERRSA